MGSATRMPPTHSHLPHASHSPSLPPPSPCCDQVFFHDGGGHPDPHTGYRLMGELAVQLMLDAAAGIESAPLTEHDRTRYGRAAGARGEGAAAGLKAACAADGARPGKVVVRVSGRLGGSGHPPSSIMDGVHQSITRSPPATKLPGNWAPIPHFSHQSITPPHMRSCRAETGLYHNSPPPHPAHE